ncbi:MAG: MFS transporter [Flavobacteriia bacterium]|nr:MFS transporter [Flavobacteriia bacterium]
MEQKNTNYPALITITSVFFFWGFVAASNDILIPVFKNHLNLEQWQSQLISFAFYLAYTIGSILYMVFSFLIKKDLLLRIGYKNGMIYGLLLSALGTLLFIPAANQASFGLMISGLFIVGLGFSLQQTAANPLTINLGEQSTGSQRLSLAGGINNIGTTIGPVLLSLAIFGTVSSGNTIANIQSIKIPYLILGLAFVLVAIVIKFSKIPNHLTNDNSDTLQLENKKSIFSFPQLTFGMLAIFLYVGVEVSTAGNFSDYLQKVVGLKTNEVSPYVSLFWASLMIGRWTSAAGAFNLTENGKKILGFVLPFAAFGLFLLVNILTNNEVGQFSYYFIPIILLIIADLMSKGKPEIQLLLFSLLGIVSLLIGMYSTSVLSIYAFISVGLFCSTLWPCIFTLSIRNLGPLTNKGSGFLIMMIMGGGFVSVFQGWLAGDQLLGIRLSYWVGVLCFVYLAVYALMNRQWIKKEQK